MQHKQKEKPLPAETEPQEDVKDPRQEILTLCLGIVDCAGEDLMTVRDMFVEEDGYDVDAHMVDQIYAVASYAKKHIENLLEVLFENRHLFLDDEPEPKEVIQ